MGVEPAVNQLQLFAGMNGPDPAKAVSLNRNRGIIVQAWVTHEPWLFFPHTQPLEK